MVATLVPPVVQGPITYEKKVYPANFGELPIGTEFTTDAVPKHRFRKSTDNRGECQTKTARSQFFHDTAPVKPIDWERPEAVIDSDSEEADGCGTDADGADGASVLSAPAGVPAAGNGNKAPGQRTVGQQQSGKNPGSRTADASDI